MFAPKKGFEWKQERSLGPHPSLRRIRLQGGPTPCGPENDRLWKSRCLLWHPPGQRQGTTRWGRGPSPWAPGSATAATANPRYWVNETSTKTNSLKMRVRGAKFGKEFGGGGGWGRGGGRGGVGVGWGWRRLQSPWAPGSAAVGGFSYLICRSIACRCNKVATPVTCVTCPDSAVRVVSIATAAVSLVTTRLRD